MALAFYLSYLCFLMASIWSSSLLLPLFNLAQVYFSMLALEGRDQRALDEPFDSLPELLDFKRLPLSDDVDVLAAFPSGYFTWKVTSSSACCFFAHGFDYYRAYNG